MIRIEIDETKADAFTGRDSDRDSLVDTLAEIQRLVRNKIGVYPYDSNEWKPETHKIMRGVTVYLYSDKAD